RVIYDWLGAMGKTGARFWRRLREGGVEVRCFNPPRFDEPFGWFARDHRKSIVADGEVAFVTGLCIGRMWEGSPERGLEPWRDTGRGSDIAVMQAISRAGYRPLLEAGVRVFEWKGPMLHAKTAVADARWSRVGSTNLNPASWLGNWELDVVVEDERFGRAMEA